MTTAPEDVRERIRSYIQHNATKEAPALAELVQTGHDRLAGLLDGVSEAQASFKPGPDDWCILDVLRHVATAKRGVARICERLARGERVSGFGGEGQEQDGIMGGQTYATIADARAAIDAAHRDLVAFISGPMAAAEVEARFAHFLFGELNCREWAAFQRVHDGDHANQIEQIKSAPGFSEA